MYHFEVGIENGKSHGGLGMLQYPCQAANLASKKAHHDNIDQ
jgi:hypothetical protein